MEMTNADTESDDGMGLGDVFTWAHIPYGHITYGTRQWLSPRFSTSPSIGTYIAVALSSSSVQVADFRVSSSQKTAQKGHVHRVPSPSVESDRKFQVVITDYPDRPLIDNISLNVKQNIEGAARERVVVQGYIWGHPVTPLLEHLPHDQPDRGFDLMILSDLIFNHSQHDAMLKTCDLALAKSSRACVLVFYSHHRPHLAHRDMEFFAKAREQGWTCEEILTRKFEPMFADDPGDEEVRATVHGWRLTRA
ncbi:hypothetical protein GSI_10482 [Ganoderma sinense ZZ0214-1]|uniref:Nicotinamide N-methyltransferase n=1 Tax=Ganoderma sinense ZZ0214-1 TaxID=1077348 RepID=A0A2G8S0R0_9APHY|nr:hypothetical protein GSI_10482 [Ganoderma sinense ZZ0214-1]